MAPSSSSARAIRSLDTAALVGLGLGLVMYVMPFMPEGRLKWAFWLTLGSTLLHVFTSHKVGSLESDSTEGGAVEGGPTQGGSA